MRRIPSHNLRTAALEARLTDLSDSLFGADMINDTQRAQAARESIEAKIAETKDEIARIQRSEDRRAKLLRIFGKRAVDEQLSHLLARRGLSALNDQAAEELIRETMAEATRRKRANARSRAFFAGGVHA